MLSFNKKQIRTCAIILALVLTFASLIPALRNPLLAITKYPVLALGFLGRETGALVFFHRNYVQNKKLKIEVDLLKNKLASSGDIALENERLKNLLDFKKQSGYRVIAASVIGRDPSNWSSVLLINRGSRNGVRRGYICVSYLGLIGKVVEVKDSVSKVMCLNDPNLCVSSIVQRSRQEGLVCGSLSSSLMMKYLPSKSDIQVGDTVTTSGLTGAYPKGLTIGAVSGVGDDLSGLSQYALVTPAIDFSALEEVLIIIP